MNCLGTCEKSVLSDTGCKCKSTKQAKKGWCHVETNGCKSLPFLPMDFFGRKYDTVTNKDEKFLCKNYNNEFEPCNPKVNKSIAKRAIKNTLLITGCLMLFGYYKVSPKLNESDEEAAKRLLKDALGYIQFQQKSGHLSEVEANNIKLFLESQFNTDPMRFIRTILTVTRKTLSKAGHETPMLDLLLSTIPKEHYGELLRGAHFILPDQGEFYKKFNMIKKSFKRISSHHPKVKDISHTAKTEYIGDTPLHLLSGIDVDGNTWLQLEASPFLEGDKWSDVLRNTFFDENLQENLFYGLEHGFDYIAYVLTKKQKNIGPFGSSKYPESKPIMLTQPIQNLMYQIDYSK